MYRLKPYLLLACIVFSSIFFSLLGMYWNNSYYHNSTTYSVEQPPLSVAMLGIHDGLLAPLPEEVSDTYLAKEAVTSQSLFAASPFFSIQGLGSLEDSKSKKEIYEPASWGLPERLPAYHMRDADPLIFLPDFQVSAPQPDNTSKEESLSIQKKTDAPKQASYKAAKNQPKSFTTVTDSYFDDAVFIGDSRTVGISEFSGIENATFLCKTSLSIYDYEKKKITYNNKKTSVKEVLSQESFGKIYLMVGINECGIGTPETFYKLYQEVVNDIRTLQPDALIFLEANLLVTKQKSDTEKSITNQNILARNEKIASLANQTDTFYIDINESSLCKEGALIAEYTWDQVHIKAQYYQVWKDFLLKHGIKEM